MKPDYKYSSGVLVSFLKYYYSYYYYYYYYYWANQGITKITDFPTLHSTRNTAIGMNLSRRQVNYFLSQKHCHTSPSWATEVKNKMVSNCYLLSKGELGTSLLHGGVQHTWHQSFSAFFHEQSPPLWALPPKGFLCDHGGASYIHQQEEYHHYQW